MFKNIDNTSKQLIKSICISGFILIVVFFLFQQFTAFSHLISSLFKIIMPFIIGFSLSFILKPLVKRFDKLLKNTKLKNARKRVVSTLCALFCLLIVIFLFVLVISPVIVESVYTLATKSNVYIDQVIKLANELMITFNIDNKFLESIFSINSNFISFVTDFFSKYLPVVIGYSIDFASSLLDILIGIAISVYILFDDERFAMQIKKMLYVTFKKSVADEIVEISRLASRIFSKFIMGKAIDSLIIGIICYLGMTIMNMPYAVLISVIVGITNMIPVFGPFIGAVPGILILVLVDPLMVVWFSVFILILQQFDGNILGPYILGDSVGLPSLWTMFAIIVGGGLGRLIGGPLLAVVGMFIGVPTFAVIYLTVKAKVEKKIDIDKIEIK